ncbi:hypothetical protein RFI_20257, partial [Reticulomyxa filosa]
MSYKAQWEWMKTKHENELTGCVKDYYNWQQIHLNQLHSYFHDQLFAALSNEINDKEMEDRSNSNATHHMSVLSAKNDEHAQVQMQEQEQGSEQICKGPLDLDTIMTNGTANANTNEKEKETSNDRSLTMGKVEEIIEQQIH